MAYRDFQAFLTSLEAKGELRRIAEPVSPQLEITEIADRVMKAGGPALLFENVVGPPHRLGTPDPLSAVMGNPSIQGPHAGATGDALPAPDQGRAVDHPLPPARRHQHHGHPATNVPGPRLRGF